MKSIKKFLFVMVALAAVWSFISCSSDDDGPKTVAVYEYGFSSGAASYTEKITFFDDGTFENVATSAYGSFSDSYPVATGTYTGDVTKDTGTDNKVTVTIEKYAYEEDEKTILLSIEDYIKETYGESDETYIKEILKNFKNKSLTIEDGVFYFNGKAYKLQK